MAETINNANAATSTLFLGHNGDWWDFWLIVSAFVAVAVAAAIGFTTAGSLVSHKREARAGESAFDRYKLETGKQIAEATARQKEAELKLEQLRQKMGPRRIDSETFLKALEGKPKAPVEIMFPRENGEAFQLAMQFRDLLRVAKWTVSEPIPAPLSDIPRLANQPPHMAAGGQPLGIGVVVRADTPEDFKIFSDHLANTPTNALSNAIQAVFSEVSEMAAGPEVFRAPALGTVRIVIGPKP
jgi:hypothetical protein